MIILDTCILIYDALSPHKLSAKANKAIQVGYEKKKLCCCDISLWEIAMLVTKGRIEPGVDIQAFLRLILQARQLEILNITVEIAALSTTYPSYKHFDPADRLIAATAMHYKADLVSCDKKLHEIPALSVVW